MNTAVYDGSLSLDEYLIIVVTKTFDECNCGTRDREGISPKCEEEMCFKSWHRGRKFNSSVVSLMAS